MSNPLPSAAPLSEEDALRAPRPRGLAALSPERRKEISAKGGKAAHATGKAYAFTPEKAREAGAKGGATSQMNGTAYKFSSEKAVEAGKKGGKAARNTPPLPDAGETE